MANRRIILATARAITASRLSRRISAIAGYEICGLAPDLSSAYVLAEKTEPYLALVGSELTRQPEFEGLISLFRMSNTSWLEIPDASSPLAEKINSDDAALASWLAGAKRPAALAHAHPLANARLTTNTAAVFKPAAPAPPSRAFLPDRVVLIGASTGGIDALLTILSAFPADCPPVAIVQHTGAAFSDSLIRLFARSTAAKVVAAQDGILLERGTVVIGAGSPGHLTLAPSKPYKSRLTPGALVSGHLPSVDMLFSSAVPFAHNVVATLLTGMGRDGARGLLELRRAGAYTFAQDEASSTVYGMPRAAAELGAAVEILPLKQMANGLLDRCCKRNTANQSAR